MYHESLTVLRNALKYTVAMQNGNCREQHRVQYGRQESLLQCSLLPPRTPSPPPTLPELISADCPVLPDILITLLSIAAR